MHVVPAVGFALFGLLGAIVAVCLTGIGWILVAFVAVLALAKWRQVAKQRARIATFVAEHPELAADPLANVLRELGRLEGSPPKPEYVRSRIEREGAEPRSYVICLGLFDVPAIGELYFEPHIITSTEVLWRKLIFVPFVVALVAFWLVQGTGFIPRVPLNLGSFTYFFVVGGVALVTWVWRSGIRPTYFRMAPGIVQVMEFGLRRRKPVIRAYPMEAGTTVVLNGNAKGVQMVTFLRDAAPGAAEPQKDVLPLAQLRRPKEALEHLWQALLSTAPIPRLSDEALIE